MKIKNISSKVNQVKEDIRHLGKKYFIEVKHGLGVTNEDEYISERVNETKEHLVLTRKNGLSHLFDEASSILGDTVDIVNDFLGS